MNEVLYVSNNNVPALFALNKFTEPLLGGRVIEVKYRENPTRTNTLIQVSDKVFYVTFYDYVLIEPGMTINHGKITKIGVEEK